MYETDPQRLSGMGDRMVPVPVPNQTMEIGTPYGHVNRPPRRVWPAALLISAIALSALAVVVAVAVSSESGDAAAAPGTEGAAAVVGDGGAAAAPAPRIARITLTTKPVGASVYDGAGLHHGVTPLVLEMPIDGREVTLVFRHPDAVERTKKFVPSGDTTLEVELPPETRAAAATPDAGASKPGARDRRKDRRRKVRTGKDGLMRPDL